VSGLQLDEASSTIKETARTEAAALLERRMAAMEAVLAARRSAPAQAAEPEMARGPGADLRFAVSRRDVNNLAASVPLLQCSSLLDCVCHIASWLHVYIHSLAGKDVVSRPAQTHHVDLLHDVGFAQGGGATSTGPAAGDGHEIILQGFNWDSHKHSWYKTLKDQAKKIAEVRVCGLRLNIRCRMLVLTNSHRRGQKHAGHSKVFFLKDRRDCL